MKQVKMILAMATGLIMISVLLGITTAQAEEVCLDGDTVMPGDEVQVQPFIALI